MDTILDLNKVNFGYAHPENVVLALILGGKYVHKYKAFKWYMEEAYAVIKSSRFFKIKDRVFPLTKEGARECETFLFGSVERLEVDSTLVEWTTKKVHLQGFGHDRIRHLYPICQIGEHQYAFTEAKNSGRAIGDNICLTGGGKPFGVKIPNSVEVPYYKETFNAGDRVHAGISGVFYIPKETISVYKVSTLF